MGWLAAIGVAAVLLLVALSTLALSYSISILVTHWGTLSVEEKAQMLEIAAFSLTLFVTALVLLSILVELHGVEGGWP